MASPKPAVVVWGNPIDGFEFVGPFEDTDSAIEWAELNTPDYDQWWTALLATPGPPDVDSTEADGALGQDHTT